MSRRLRAALVVAALVGPAAAAPVAAAAAPAPGLSAPSAILVQPQTGDVVLARGADRRRPIASITKLMTALLALERRSLSDRMTTVGYAAAPAESVAGFGAGEQVTTADLIRALLVASGNDAAATIAVNVGGTTRRFVRLMNQRARRAGLTHTHYDDPIGLSAGNTSTARDLAKLALLVRRSAFARAVMDRPQVVLRSGARVRVLANRNTLVGAVPWVDGVKTGHTQSAGWCLVGAGRRDGVELVSVVLGTPSEEARNADTLALLRWGFTRYDRVTVATPARPVARLPVTDQDREVAIVPARTVRVVARRGERPRVRTTGLPDAVEGPATRGTRVGLLVVSLRGRVVERVPLVTATAVARASLWQRTGALHGPVAGAVILAAALVGAASLTAGRRRARRRAGTPRSETA